MGKTFIDLFCGCGGMSLGFQKAGLRPLLGIDSWADAIATYGHNIKGAKTICGDILEVSSEQIKATIGNKKVDVIIGGPPCQGFSVAGKRIVEDKRNELYKAFVRIVKDLSPEIFVMENVPNILTIGDGIIKEAILKDFSRLGYNVSYKVLTASDYGTPQNRRRAFFVGTKENIDAFEFPSPTTLKKVTTEEALSDLPENSLKDGSAYPNPPLSKFQTKIRQGSSGVYNHQITEHNPETKRIIAMVPDGGNYKDLPKSMWDIRKVHIAWTRMNSQKPCFTIDTGHRHHFHYKWNRIPTARESARIQSFPDDFIFLCSRTSQFKQIGNAVPPMMAYAVANKVKELL